MVQKADGIMGFTEFKIYKKDDSVEVIRRHALDYRRHIDSDGDGNVDTVYKML